MQTKTNGKYIIKEHQQKQDKKIFYKCKRFLIENQNKK